jgi:pimeloyl-ACP methyl ester carboxylesterase
MAEDWSEEITRVAGTDLAIIKGGRGKPLLVLHEEMGHPGWLNWHRALAAERTILIPIQPGFGKSPRIDAIRNVHELGLFYSWMLRDMNLGPVDVIGFSLGGWAAAEMATANPKQFR